MEGRTAGGKVQGGAIQGRINDLPVVGDVRTYKGAYKGGAGGVDRGQRKW